MIPPGKGWGWAFPERFARFGQTLRLPEQGALPLPDLLRPAGLARVMARYAASFPGGDRRAVLSMWSQRYLLALVPAVVAAALVARRDLPVALDGMGVVLSEAGQPTALCLPHAGCPSAASCPAARLTPLLRAHLQPLIQGLAAAGLPPRVLWGNAGATLAWTLDVIAAPADQAAVARQALEGACWVDGGTNPLYPVLSRGGCGLGRRVCCLRCRLPGVTRCPDCPQAGRAGSGAAKRKPSSAKGSGENAKPPCAR